MNTEQNSKKEQRSKLAYFLLLAGSISFLIVFPTVFLLLIGMGFDAITHKSPMFAVGGAIVGFLSSFFNIHRLLKRLKI